MRHISGRRLEMNELLVVSGLNAGYGKLPILRDVAVDIHDGEVVAILGPNGAGKTTLLKTISGLVKPSSGRISFDGQCIEGLGPHTIARLGIAHVPEGSRPFSSMTVRENLLMGAYVNREVLKEGILDEIFTLFPVLEQRQGQTARTLSGGEKQMLAIGRGLAPKPRLLMLDEPSLGLAPNLVDEIFEKIRILKEQGMPVLLVEQNVVYALELADRAYVLENGRIVLEGSGEELLQSTHVKEHYLGIV